MTGAVILAAGIAKRFGSPKQFLPFRGTTLLEHTITVISEAMEGPIVITSGAEHARIQDLAAKNVSSNELKIAKCADWSEGMGTSLACGVSRLCNEHPEVNSILVSVCDQPHLSREIILALLRLHAESPDETVATTYRGTSGSPACFARSDFATLKRLKGDRGAKALLTDPAKTIRTVNFPMGAIDVDTPSDYHSLLNITEPH